MFKKFVIICLDGLGVGALPDVSLSRKEDIGSNSLRHVIERVAFIRMPVLKSLGLEHALHLNSEPGKVHGEALFTVAKQKYTGVDAFLSHQEILGLKPRKILAHPFSTYMEDIAKLLIANGLSVLRYRAEEDKTGGVLIVNNSLIIGDEVDFDFGHTIRLTALFDTMPFNVAVDIGKLIKQHVKSDCVTVCGTSEIDFKILFKGYQTKEGRYAGISVPLSRIYNENYKLMYLGNYINYKNRITHKLLETGVKSTLIGASVDNGGYKEIDTYNTCNLEEIYSAIEDAMKRHDNRFIFANISDLTLAGRAKDIKLYANMLEHIDTFLGKVTKLIEGSSILVVMGGHGADPLVQYQKYTREYVPVLIHSKSITYGSFSERESLADVSATASDYFNSKKPELGESFYSLMF